MEKQCLTFDLALRLQAIGFKEKGLGFFLNDKGFRQYGYSTYVGKETPIEAPTWGRALEWISENHKLYGWSTSKTIEGDETIYIPHGRTIPDTIKNNLVVDLIPYTTSKSSYDANRICLEHLIEIVEKRLK